MSLPVKLIVISRTSCLACITRCLTKKNSTTGVPSIQGNLCFHRRIGEVIQYTISFDKEGLLLSIINVYDTLKSRIIKFLAGMNVN